MRKYSQTSLLMDFVAAFGAAQGGDYPGGHQGGDTVKV